jgi:uncharacterized protein
MNEEQFLRGVEEFNSHRFFECHDTLEDLWHETRGHDRLFLQGLIQVSVGFYHILNRNFKGAFSQWTKAADKLTQYRPIHKQINLELLLPAVAEWRLIAGRGVNGEHIDIDESRIPKFIIQP